MLIFSLQANADNLLTATVAGKRKREVGLVVLAKFTTFTQELKNAKILKRDLNERASRYTHFKKSITIAKNKFPLLARTALQRLQCIFITLWKYSNKRRTGTVALIRVHTVIANIAPGGRFYSDTFNTLNFATKSRTIDEPQLWGEQSVRAEKSPRSI